VNIQSCVNVLDTSLIYSSSVLQGFLVIYTCKRKVSVLKTLFKESPLVLTKIDPSFKYKSESKTSTGSALSFYTSLSFIPLSLLSSPTVRHSLHLKVKVCKVDLEMCELVE